MRLTKYASRVALILIVFGVAGCASTTKTSIKASVTYYPIESKRDETCVTLSIEKHY